MRAIISLMAACLLAAVPSTVLSAPTNGTVEAPTNGTIEAPVFSPNGTNVTTNATYLDAPYGGKVWVITTPASEYSNTHEVIALWEEVKNATTYRFCLESPAFIRRCYILNTNKLNVGSTLDVVLGSASSIEKMLWSVRAEAGNTTSEWASVLLQNSSTIGEYNSTLKQYCGVNITNSTEPDPTRYPTWTVTAKPSELAVGNATSAVVDATWGAKLANSEDAFKPEGGYMVCVEIQGVKDPSDGGDLWSEECEMYLSDVTMKNIRVQNVSAGAKEAYVHVSPVGYCNDGSQGDSEPFEVRQLSMALNYTARHAENLCVGKSKNEAKDSGNIPAVGSSCNDSSMLWQFYYVNPNNRKAEGGFRLRAKMESGEVYCLTSDYANFPGKFGFAVCSTDTTDKAQLFTTEDVRIKQEDSQRSEGITCIVPATVAESGTEKALIIGSDGELTLGNCSKKATSWSFDIITA